MQNVNAQRGLHFTPKVLRCHWIRRAESYRRLSGHDLCLQQWVSLGYPNAPPPLFPIYPVISRLFCWYDVSIACILMKSLHSAASTADTGYSWAVLSPMNAAIERIRWTSCTNLASQRDNQAKDDYGQHDVSATLDAANRGAFTLTTESMIQSEYAAHRSALVPYRACASHEHHRPPATSLALWFPDKFQWQVAVAPPPLLLLLVGIWPVLSRIWALPWVCRYRLS